MGEESPILLLLPKQEEMGNKLPILLLQVPAICCTGFI